MNVTMASGGGVVGPMELGPVDTETIDRGLGQKIEDLVRDSFSNLSSSELKSLPHPNEPWSAVAIVDSVRAGRLPGKSTQQLEDLLQQAGSDWHRPSSSSGVSPIFGHWVHSREEDADGVRIYRPRDFDFPPSRGREGFEITENGTFIAHEIGPGDGLVKASARWTIDRLRIGFDGQRPPYALEILSYDANTLRVRDVPDEEQES